MSRGINGYNNKDFAAKKRNLSPSRQERQGFLHFNSYALRLCVFARGYSIKSDGDIT
jgi:hypothetical protein